MFRDYKNVYIFENDTKFKKVLDKMSAIELFQNSTFGEIHHDFGIMMNRIGMKSFLGDIKISQTMFARIRDDKENNIGHVFRKCPEEIRYCIVINEQYDMTQTPDIKDGTGNPFRISTSEAHIKKPNQVVIRP